MTLFFEGMGVVGEESIQAKDGALLSCEARALVISVGMDLRWCSGPC